MRNTTFIEPAGGVYYTLSNRYRDPVCYSFKRSAEDRCGQARDRGHHVDIQTPCIYTTAYVDVLRMYSVCQILVSVTACGRKPQLLRHIITFSPAVFFVIAVIPPSSRIVSQETTRSCTSIQRTGNFGVGATNHCYRVV